MTNIPTCLLSAILLYHVTGWPRVESKQQQVIVGLFAEEDDMDVISLLNQSLADDELSDNEERLQYRMTTEITSRRYDTYSLASSLCHTLSRQISMLFSVLPCEAIPALVQLSAYTSLPTFSWTTCLENPKSDWMVYMTSPQVSIQSALRRLVLSLGWRRLVFIYDDQADPDLVGDVAQELRMYDVSMILMAYSDMAFNLRRDVWHSERNYLVYCSLKALNHTLQESRVNRLDFMGPLYRWLLLDPGSVPEADVAAYLQEGDNFAIIKPAKVSLKHQISVGADLLKEVVSNLTELGYQYPELSCRLDQLPNNNNSNNISLIMNTELQEMQWSPFRIKTYVRLPTGNMGFRQVGDVTNKGVLRLRANVYPELSRGFNGRIFVITTIQYEPFTLKTEDGRWEGIMFELLDELATSMNFSYIVNETMDEKFGIDTGNGSFNGVIGTVQRREVDFAMGPITITRDRESVVDFTTPYWEDGYIILIRRPDPGESKTFICLGPFSEMVWGIVIISLFVTSATLWISLNYYPGPRDRKPSKNGWPLLSFVTWQTFGALMQQGMVEEPIVTSARVVVSMWWFYVIVVAGVYNGNLIAFLTAPKTHLPINSLMDLANSDMMFGTLRDAAFHGIIEKADSGVYKQLWDKVKDDVDNLFYDDPDEAMRRVLADKKYAFVIEASYYTMLHIRNSTISRMQCQFARPNYHFLTNMYGFAFQKGSPYTSAFSMQILRILESGLFQRIRRRWVSNGYRCTGLERVASQTNISLREAQGAFYILGIGIIAAILVLFVEGMSKSRCWSYRPGFGQRPVVGPQPGDPRAPGGGGSRASGAAFQQQLGPIRQYDVELGTPPCNTNSEQLPLPKEHTDVDGTTKRSGYRNGYIQNGAVYGKDKAKDKAKVKDGLHYSDLFTGKITPSGLVYDRTGDVTSSSGSASRWKLSEPPTRRRIDSRVAVRRRCNSCAAAGSANGKIVTAVVNNNDAETGEVTIRTVAEMSYL